MCVLSNKNKNEEKNISKQTKTKRNADKKNM